MNHGYVGEMPNQVKKELYGSQWKNKPVWHLFVLSGNQRFNTYAYGDFNGDKKQDAAFVITNAQTKQNKLIVLEVNPSVGNDYGTELFSMDMPEGWYYIRSAHKGWKYYVDSVKMRIPLDGILIGSNRDQALNDPVWLLLFDGKQFRLHAQPEESRSRR